MIFGLLLHCCIFLFGCSSFVLRNNEPRYIRPGYHEFIVQTDAYPAGRPRSLMLHTSIISVDGTSGYKNNKLLLYLNKRSFDPGLIPGSIIRFRSEASEIKDFNTTDNFDYSLFMKRKGFRYLSFCYDSISFTGYKPSVMHMGLRLRRYLLNKLENSLPHENSLAIVSAMTLGYRELIDSDIKEEFRRSGIIHILAVSGLHVGIISLIIILLLKITGIRSGLIKLLVSLLLIWTYALLTGLSPSVTRAAVMFSFLNTGYFIYRPVVPLNSVMASAFIILLINPLMIFEASFLLSYSAVIFILMNYHNLVVKINFSGQFLNTIWKMLAISFLAQAGTIPFVALFFGEIPLFPVLSGLFAIPLAGIILFTGFSLIAFSAVPFISGMLSSLLIYCVNTLSGAAAFISSWNTATVPAEGVSAAGAVILFLLLLSLMRYILKKENKNPHMVLTFMILYFAIS